MSHEDDGTFVCGELDERGMPAIGSPITIVHAGGERYSGVVRDWVVTADDRLVMRLEMDTPVSSGGQSGKHIAYSIPLANLEFEKTKLH